MPHTLVIVGGGVAGLAAGCYARMNGYPTTILEMGDTPGGLCTSWRRKGYLFDGSVAGLAGSAPGSPLYRLWQELGVAAYCPLYHGENFGHVLLPDGRRVTVFTNIDRLESHLLDLFPRDERPIRELATALRSVLDLDIPFSDAHGWAAVREKTATALASAKTLPVLLKYGRMTIREFAAKFQDTGLVTAFTNFVHFGGRDVPMLTVLLPLAYAHRGQVGIPLRGWLAFSRAIERRLVELGGEIRYGARVERLTFEGRVATGVLLADGSRVAADRVLSAADGRFSHSRFLGRDDDGPVMGFDPRQVSDQPVQVNLGVRDDWASEDGAVTFILPVSFAAAGREHSKITVQNKAYDAEAAPTGNSALTIFLDSDYGWWKDIATDRARYTEEKQHCADEVVASIGRYRPGFADLVEVVDVATPLTRERYTGNWMGAMQARKPSANMIRALMQGAPAYASREIDGLYMAGQWVEAWGGITTAAQSGRKAVKAMCRRDGKPFAATTVSAGRR